LKAIVPHLPLAHHGSGGRLELQAYRVAVNVAVDWLGLALSRHCSPVEILAGSTGHE